MFSYVLITPSSRGLSTALARHYLQNTPYFVFATHRSDDEQLIRSRILGTDPGQPETATHHHPQPSPDRKDSTLCQRLTLLPLELTSEDSIASAANQLARCLPPDARLHAAWITGGILHTEKRPQDIDHVSLLNSFKVNVISHLLIIKHFSRFLPEYYDHQHQPLSSGNDFSRWVHVSARLGSISDNHSGGWYSYRSSKAALNQVIKTFDIQLQTQSRSQSPSSFSDTADSASSVCIGVHPGTVKTDLSKSYWGTDSKGHFDPELMEPEEAAAKLVNVVENLNHSQRGRVWDWKGTVVGW